MPYETGELGDSGVFMSIAGEGKHLFEADQVSARVEESHRAFFRVRMRQYRFEIVQESFESLLQVDWGVVYVRVPAGASPDAARLIASLPGVIEAQASPVLTTNVVARRTTGGYGIVRP